MSNIKGDSSELADYGTRSTVKPVIMATGVGGALVSGLVIEGQTGLVSMVAVINFTPGVGICQSIHSLGNTGTDTNYEGVLMEVLRRAR